jgi:hypothetical protein
MKSPLILLPFQIIYNVARLCSFTATGTTATMSAEGDGRIQLSSVKPDTTEICTNVKSSSSSH